VCAWSYRGVPPEKDDYIQYWDDHAGFGYQRPHDVDLLDHWRCAGVNYLSINVGYDPVP
jgi:hypothetical protein